MKRKKYLLFVSLVAVGSLLYMNKPNQTKVTVNSKSYLTGIDDITDANLKKCIQEDDEYENGIENITNLVCYDKNINSVAGINQLTNLEYLDLDKNNLSSFDINSLPNLNYLDLSENNFSSINLGSSSSLESLKLSSNNLSNIDVSNLSSLKLLYIHANKNIKSLDLSHNAELTELYASDLTSVDLSHNPNMKSLYVPDIPSVKLHSNAKIERLLVTYKYLNNYNVNSMSSLNTLKINDNKTIYLYGDTLTKDQILKQVPSNIKVNSYKLLDLDLNDIGNNFSSGSYKPSDTFYVVYFAAMDIPVKLQDDIEAGSVKVNGVNDSVTTQGYRSWLTFRFTKLTSSKYTIDEANSVIDVEVDDDATVLKNVKVNREEASVKIENNKLKVFVGNDLIKEFTLKRITNPSTGMSSIYVVALILIFSVAMVIGMNKLNTRNNVE